ncbi:hypothetical protein [Tenacibaculum aiptasiae]|uniref:hypothetical protein n=1 Tax=Tenacibaculum aiptasiae TaxID=426481 RepID=UPI00232C37DF|nr:hypothetical protein [Tenacibaculum aiptasiae]
MALIFLGKSECSICNKVLKTTDEIIGWSPFLNAKHKFWKYSDSGMHENCFNNWEHKVEFEHLYKYQPLIDFDDPNLKERIKINGMPDWLKEVIEYRKTC